MSISWYDEWHGNKERNTQQKKMESVHNIGTTKKGGIIKQHGYVRTTKNIWNTTLVINVIQLP